MVIFVLLSLGVIAGVFLLMPPPSKGSPVLRASLLWGFLLVVSTEILSLGGLITVAVLSIFWIGTFLVFTGRGIWLWRKGHRFAPGWDWRQIGVFEGISLALIAAMLLVTLFVALKSPIQTWDSLTYHMARVAHWTQNHSVGVYASGIERQNVMGPMAEYAVLHVYIMQGGDALVNLVNWFAYAGCIFASAHVAGLLGANRSGKILAALAAASLPMAIAQASSTTTDIVVAYWTLCLAAEILAAFDSSQNDWSPFAFMGAATGLALLTKATAVAFLLPLFIWFALTLIFKKNFKRLFLSGATVLVMVLLTNGLFGWRMYHTYGTPLGPPAIINYHRNELLTPAAMISNTLKNASLHFRTDNDDLRLLLLKVIVKSHQWIGLGPADPRISMNEFAVPYPTASEDLMPNPAHLIIFGICALVCFNPKSKDRTTLFYVLTVIGSFLLFSIGNKWQVFGVRLQTPFFVLTLPIVGLVLGRWHLVLRVTAILILAFFARTALFSIQDRAIIPVPGLTSETSILQSRRADLFGVSGAKKVAEKLQTIQCRDVGLMLSGDDAEYAYWFYLGYPQNQVRIEWIVAGTPSAQYSDTRFEPCAVVCTSCDPGLMTDRFPETFEIGTIRLFYKP